MIKVMFLCTGNSCRSQMAEGFGHALGREIIETHSAGLMPAGVNPHAIRIMQEIGIDISEQESKRVDEHLLRQMDTIVTLCGHAEQMCPMTPPGIQRLHWPIDDPVGATGTEEQILKEFRRAREEIKEKVQEFLSHLEYERN